MDDELAGYRVIAPLRGGQHGGGVAPAPGGPARIWSGIRLADDGPVALKVFHPADAALASREAALAGAVDHPHVVPVLDVVRTARAVALVMPLASGGDLATLVGVRRRLPWPEALTVLIPLADALSAAHERGMVHGDLSGGNVLFDAAGKPMLADLGAARACAELGGPVAATPTDAAPEIARGAAASPETDLFSLGSVALRCLSGSPAWPADDLQDVLIQSAAGQWPDPDDLLGPPELLTIVRRLLDPEPDRRGSAARAAVELRGVGSPEPVALMVTGPDGTVTGPAPATEVRRDAPRPPSATGVRRRRHARVGRRRTGRARDRIAGLGAARPPVAEAGAGRGSRPRRWRRAVVVAAVVLLLGAGSVEVGLWWAGRGATAPTAVAAIAPGAGSTAPVAEPASSQPAAEPGSSRQVPSRQVSSQPAASEPGSDTDWLVVVSRLDDTRALAITSRDPGLLDRVYTGGAPAREADARRIAELTEAGYRVDAATHHVTAVALVGLGGGGAVRLRVVESQPSYTVRDAHGSVVAATTASPSSAVLMHLVPADGGFRISLVERD